MKRAFLTIIVFLLSAVLIACADAPARNPVPAELTAQVGIDLVFQRFCNINNIFLLVCRGGHVV